MKRIGRLGAWPESHDGPRLRRSIEVVAWFASRRTLKELTEQWTQVTVRTPLTCWRRRSDPCEWRILAERFPKFAAPFASCTARQWLRERNETRVDGLASVKWSFRLHRPPIRVKSMQKRILVTGGAGFLGSHLCERLLEAGHDVLCVDNFFTGSRRNVAHLLNNPSFEFLRHDVTFPLYVEVDEIYNLACPASPIHYQFDPVQTTKTSVIGAINMLGLAKRVKAKFLQASTSEVYGDPTVHPQPEEYWGHVNPIGFRSCYDEGKRCAETLVFDYNRQHRMAAKIVRIFNTYGPRMHPNDGRVVSNFVMQALSGEDITLYGDGGQTRSFCYVDDLVEAMIRMMATGRGNDRADQHRQSDRIYDQGTGRIGPGTDWLEIRTRIPALAVGRSQTASTGHS